MQQGLNMTPKQEQSLTITKQMEQSIKILEMDTAELREYLQEAALENPAMDMDSVASDSPDALSRKKLEWLEQQARRDKEYVGYYEPNDDYSLEKTVAAPAGESLQEHLMQQAGFICKGQQLGAVRYLTGFLGDNGYLLQPVGEIAKDGAYSQGELEEALHLVQSLDPPGVGASGLVECLLLQLPKEAELERAIVEKHLKELAKNRLEQIAKSLKVTCDQVREACGRILKLNPKPGSAYALPEPPVYITPDVLVTSFQDRYYVLPCEFAYPQVQLNSAMLALAEEASDPEAVAYIQQKVKQVEWLQKCVSSRVETLLSVTRAIVKHQERFFRYGPQYLNVLRMSDIATALEMHESTVSRAVKHKYLQCPHGMFPLRYFFVQGTKTGDGETSSHTIKNRIAGLIEQEDHKTPLSDQKIADILLSEGAAVSRRTVAKYREQLGIPNTSYRR